MPRIRDRAAVRWPRSPEIRNIFESFADPPVGTRSEAHPFLKQQLMKTFSNAVEISDRKKRGFRLDHFAATMPKYDR
jgi:hypothetical protein